MEQGVEKSRLRARKGARDRQDAPARLQLSRFPQPLGRLGLADDSHPLAPARPISQDDSRGMATRLISVKGERAREPGPVRVVSGRIFLLRHERQGGLNDSSIRG